MEVFIKNPSENIHGMASNIAELAQTKVHWKLQFKI